MPATDKTVYNLKTMHVVFLVSVLAFLAATVTMLLRDHDDEWRAYQKIFFGLESQMLRAQELDALNEAVGAAAPEEAAAAYRKEIQRLESSRDSIESDLKSGSAEFQELTTKVAELALAFDLQGRDVRVERAERDVARANYDLQVRDQAPEAQIKKFFGIFQSAQAKVDGLELRWEQVESELTFEQEKLAAITKDRDAMQDQLKTLMAEVDRIRESLDVIAPSGGLKSAKRRLMEMPIADGFNSHMRLVQDWLPDLDIKLGMAKTARFDRCRTCHLGIDRFGAGNVPTFPHGEVDSSDPTDWVAANSFPQPYSSHPRPELYLTAASPHPLPEFGCTICHDGQGSATNFTNAQHGPNDPVEEHEWHEKHSHSHNHFWEYPMFPKRLRDAACLKCHHDVIELGVNPEFGASAPKAYRGWQLIQKYGCFGCHEINGFDGADRIGPDLRLEPTSEEAEKYASDPNLIPGKMRKVGPSLKRIADKTTAEWIAYWTEKPKRFRPTTKMPQFFGLTNLEDHLGAQLSKLEIRAVAKFLISQSSTGTDEAKLLSPPAGYKPDAERGRKAFTEKGCLACHSHDGDEFKGSNATFGPNLTKVGQKVRSGQEGFNWLYTWISDPERHHPRTKMPNLFLKAVRNDKEELVSDPAADIAQFLIGSGDYPVAPLELDVVKKSLHGHLVSGRLLTEDEFEAFWDDHKYPHEAEWPETLLTSDEAGELDWETILSRYLEATEYKALARRHLVADDLLNTAEFDEFWKSRKYPTRSGADVAPVVWPEKQHLQQATAATDSEWAAVLKSYLDAKATLELSRLYLPGKVLTADQFETLWGINWKGERAARKQVSQLQEKLDGLPAGDDGKETDQQKLVRGRLADAQAKLDAILNGARKLPLTRDQIKGDEIELYSEGDTIPSPEEWDDMMLDFLGRRSVSRYGCYACHDINGFGEARPIGTALQDWGRKDPSRLAPEHIHEYLHHHGRRDGSSTQQYVQDALDKANSDSFDSEEERETAMQTAFFYDSLIHHGRPGFIFQKLRQPRSYDYKKVDTKRYNERLVMPQFPLTDEEIEAISTFVLGLVAEPPAAKYVYSPDQRTKDRNQGEILLQKYNCVGCHVIDMPEMEFAASDVSQFLPTEPDEKGHAEGLEALLRIRPPVQGYFGKSHGVVVEDEEPETLPVVRVRGLPTVLPDPDDPDDEEQMHAMVVWEPVRTRGALAARFQDRHIAVKKMVTRLTTLLASQSLSAATEEALAGAVADPPDWMTEAQDGNLSSVNAAAMGQLDKFFNSSSDAGPLAVTKEELVTIAAVFRVIGQTSDDATEAATAAEELATELAEALLPGSMGDTLLPNSPVFADVTNLVKFKPARGGAFAEWLVEYQTENGLTRDAKTAWQNSPPPLFREGEKVQTDWLYRFLKNPTQIRFTTLLRMPGFNLSDEEARILTNYFAAADGAVYPYEKQPQQRAPYLAGKEAEFHAKYPERSAVNSYRDESWRMLTSTLCISCHAVGNDAPKGDPSKPGELIRGPNLNQVHERLRPDWVSLWLFNPAWITSYTSMPAPFGTHQAGDKNQYRPLFEGNPLDQTIGVRDALMNYPEFLELRYKPLPLIGAPATTPPAAN